MDLEKYQSDIRQALQAAKGCQCAADYGDYVSWMNTMLIWDYQYKIDGLTLGMSVGVHPCEDIAMLKVQQLKHSLKWQISRMFGRLVRQG